MSKRRRASSRSRRTTSSRGQRTTLSTIVGVVVVLLIYLAFPELMQDQPSGQPDTPGGPAAGEQARSRPNLALGNPSGATADPTNPSDYLIVRDQYVLSYNRDARIPNWGSWHLSRSDIGEVDRSDFQPDTSLPAGWYQVKPSDYTNSGYDRGHIVPSADRTATLRDNEMVFLMTNIVPQAPDNNQGPWAQLEEYCRTLARDGNELYIVGGVSGTQATLPKGKVRVPEGVWKVVVVLPEGDDDLARVDEQTTIIAVDMPNRQGIRNDDWREYLTSVDDLEQLTGYDLLAELDPELQARLEGLVASP